MTVQPPHRLFRQVRELREARRLSLGQVETRHPDITAQRLASWERGDRHPTVDVFDEVLRQVFGKQLAIVPEGVDIDAVLAELYDLRRFKEHIVGQVRVEERAADAVVAR